MQDWNEKFPETLEKYFHDSNEVCQAVFSTFKEDGVDVTLIKYKPELNVHGTDVTPEGYGKVEMEVKENGED